jgi:hypothetical protein
MSIINSDRNCTIHTSARMLPSLSQLLIGGPSKIKSDDDAIGTCANERNSRLASLPEELENLVLEEGAVLAVALLGGQTVEVPMLHNPGRRWEHSPVCEEAAFQFSTFPVVTVGPTPTIMYAKKIKKAILLETWEDNPWGTNTMCMSPPKGPPRPFYRSA